AGWLAAGAGKGRQVRGACAATACLAAAGHARSGVRDDFQPLGRYRLAAGFALTVGALLDPAECFGDVREALPRRGQQRRVGGGVCRVRRGGGEVEELRAVQLAGLLEPLTDAGEPVV